MRFDLGKLTTFLTAVTLFTAIPAHAQMVGFESEFATVGFLSSEWGERQLQLSKRLLEIVKSSFDNQGEIKLVPWTKYPQKNLQNYVFIDPLGREWKIEPESVNSGGLDGLEFVSPPLSTPEDMKHYVSILSEFKKTKTLMRGLRSSGHITVDVSHLMKNPYDISELVDRILTIENHWAETYRFFDPVRYGTKINRFSVPLAVDQQDLLAELAAMPREQRTFANVRNVFLKYDQREGLLRDADQTNATRKWKYRAANYGKLFALKAGESPLYAIEFRLDDLNFGGKVDENIFYVRRLVTSPNLDKVFKAPFGMKPLKFEQANARLAALPLDANFFRDKITAQKFAQINSPSSQRAEEPDLSDMTRPVGIDDNVITFGFEAEFKGAETSKIIDDEGTPNLKRFPFLDVNTSEETSGNIEVRSVGGEQVLTEVIEQMNQLRSTLKGSLRGFHLHMRVPSQVIAKHNPNELKAWLSMTSDAVFAWRLQNRPHFFALKTWSLARQNISRIDERGPMRTRVLPDGSWDIEIRGYMTSSEMIGMMTQKIVTGLTHPEFIRISSEERDFYSNERLSLEDSMNQWSKTQLGRSLTAQEKSSLASLNSEIQGIGLLPLYDFKRIPGLDSAQRRKISDSTNLFFKETYTVLQNMNNGKYTVATEAGKQFRWRVKRWAQAIDLQSLLEKQILRTAPESPNANFQRMNKARRHSKISKIEKALLDPQSTSVFPEGRAPEALLNDPAYLQLLSKGLTNADSHRRSNSLAQFSGQSDKKFLPLFIAASQDADPVIRSQAIAAIDSQKPEDRLAILERTSKDTDAKVRASTAVAVSHLLSLPSAQLIFDRLLNDKEKTVSAAAVSSMILRGGTSYSSRIIEMINQKQLSPSPALIMALGRMNDVQSFAALKSLAKATDVETRSTVVTALATRPEREAFQIILQNQDDQAESVRSAVVLSLDGKSGSDAEAALVHALKDPEPMVQMQALNLLTKFPNRHSNPIYTELLKSPEDFIGVMALKLVLADQDTIQFRRFYADQMNASQLNLEQKNLLKLEYNKRFGSLTRALPNLSCQAAFR